MKRGVEVASRDASRRGCGGRFRMGKHTMKTGMRRGAGMALAGAAGVWAMAGAAVGQTVDTWGPPTWRIERIGLFGPAYENAAGIEYAFVYGMTPTGRVFGSSNSRGGGTIYWTWTPGGSAVHVGLTDAAHTSLGGGWESDDVVMNAGGMIAGESTIFSRNQRAGTTAWVWEDGRGTVAIELADPEHTSPAGLRITEVAACADSGYVCGTARRWSGRTNGLSSWVWSREGGVVVVPIAVDAFTRADGYRAVETWDIRGTVAVGVAARYQGMADAGRSAWYWDAAAGGDAIVLGLIDAEHTRADGYRESYANQRTLAEDGSIFGSSARFDGANSAGDTPWRWRPGLGYETFGLTDGEHTGASGERSSYALPVAGNRAVGASVRYVSGAAAGRTAWIRDGGGTTHRYGLTDAEHTGPTGERTSVADAASDGVVRGTSSRFVGGVLSGETAWIVTASGEFVTPGLFDGAHHSTQWYYQSLIRYAGARYAAGTSSRLSGGVSAWCWTAEAGSFSIGLTDGIHTRADGGRDVRPVFCTDSGQIVGTSKRHISSPGDWRSGWVYDVNSGRTETLVFSVGPAGQAFTFPCWAAPSGAVYGAYQRFEPDGSSSMHSFIWSRQRGMADLGELARGGLASIGLVGSDFVDFAIGVDGWDGGGPRGITARGTLDRPDSQALYAITVPDCLADFDGDGVASSADRRAFIDAFIADGPRADWNGDGFVDAFDLLGFVDTLDRGC